MDGDFEICEGCGRDIIYGGRDAPPQCSGCGAVAVGTGYCNCEPVSPAGNRVLRKGRMIRRYESDILYIRNQIIEVEHERSRLVDNKQRLEIELEKWTKV